MCTKTSLVPNPPHFFAPFFEWDLFLLRDEFSKKMLKGKLARHTKNDFHSKKGSKKRKRGKEKQKERNREREKERKKENEKGSKKKIEKRSKIKRTTKKRIKIGGAVQRRPMRARKKERKKEI